MSHCFSNLQIRSTKLPLKASWAFLKIFMTGKQMHYDIYATSNFCFHIPSCLRGSLDAGLLRLFWWCVLKLLLSSVEIRLRLEQLLYQALMHPVSWGPRLLGLSSCFSDTVGVMGPGQALSDVNSEGSEAFNSLHCCPASADRPFPLPGFFL